MEAKEIAIKIVATHVEYLSESRLIEQIIDGKKMTETLFERARQRAKTSIDFYIAHNKSEETKSQWEEIKNEIDKLY